MEIHLREAKSILGPQRGGFLASGTYPYTHTLSCYVGCGFGSTTCGMYCYAQFLPNWSFVGGSATWGSAVHIKANAPQLLDETLAKMRPATRQKLRIFMSSSTDPYQPLENKYQLTRQCLEVFARYPDLDLLLIQTRSPLVERDLALIKQIPYAWLSMTIETNDQSYLKNLRGGPPLEKRWQAVRAASQQDVPTQIAVSPCLPYTSAEQFGQWLIESSARRIIVDTMVDGDGTAGYRTSHSPYAQAVPDWSETRHARQLYDHLRHHPQTRNITIGWSLDGFSIPPRIRKTEDLVAQPRLL
ncbi:SPL family radical SAM protein [Dictyobacter aurantiacus]|uniref:Radical SAM protein n=1 Tax=Dictyobacter aurantiacus TaxID=1936993 RepID=A0A401ZL37_9CHLR|nr:radical SAM protein [Dictyobacter aurantiacus]GCE07566.1 hypothetical protein KDAU_48950 [Dictyobacter aurantiacus]